MIESEKESEEEKARKVAKLMINDGIPLEKISRMTGLTIEAVQELDR